MAFLKIQQASLFTIIRFIQRDICSVTSSSFFSHNILFLHKQIVSLQTLIISKTTDLTEKHFFACQRIVWHGVYVGRVQTCLGGWGHSAVFWTNIVQAAACVVTSALLTKSGSWKLGHQRREESGSCWHCLLLLIGASQWLYRACIHLMFSPEGS